MERKRRSVTVKRLWALAVLLLTTMLAAACSSAEDPVPTQTTPPTEPPMVDIGGSTVDHEITRLDLSDGSFELDVLTAAAERLTEVAEIELGLTQLSAEQMQTLRDAFPSAAIYYSVEILGQTFSWNETDLDYSGITPEQALETLPQLALLANLQRINFIAPEGLCAWSVEDIPILDQLRTAAPNADFRIQFELFGQTVTSEDARIEFYLVDIGNEGVETIRAALPYLSACEYLLMDGCGVDHEVMAELRDDFPETKVVWRIWLGYPDYNSAKSMRSYSFLTDTHRIRTTRVNDSNCYLLQYCTETKYVDFGHNLNISDFSFLAYMPKLEVAILALTGCSDLSPLANCPELEYLEIYRSKVTDLSPLANCTKLKHLNFGDMEISDITCLYGLELERMRGCATNVPEEQFEEYARLHPDCQMLNEGYSPSKNGWRYDENNQKVPRYALLQEQMEYSTDFQYGIP